MSSGVWCVSSAAPQPLHGTCHSQQSAPAVHSPSTRNTPREGGREVVVNPVGTDGMPPTHMGWSENRERGPAHTDEETAGCRCVLYLCKVGRLPDSINSTEGDDIWTTFVLSLHHVPENVDSAFGAEDLHQTLLHTGLYQTLDTCERGRDGSQCLHQ